MRPALRQLAPLVAYMALVLVLSLVPEPPEPPGISGIDKLYHFIAYAVMGILTARAVAGRPAGKGAGPSRTLILAALIPFIYGGAIETIQASTTQRSGEVLDAILNGAGALVGSFAYLRLKGCTGKAGEREAVP